MFGQGGEGRKECLNRTEGRRGCLDRAERGGYGVRSGRRREDRVLG